MKITETITNTTITVLLTSIAGFFGILLGSLYSEVVPIFYPTLVQNVSKELLIKICTLAIAVIFLLIALTFFMYLKYKPKLKPKFGVLWDKYKEAHCPACETLLSSYTEHQVDSRKAPYFFWCHQCKTNIFLYHGNPIPLSEAQKLL